MNRRYPDRSSTEAKSVVHFDVDAEPSDIEVSYLGWGALAVIGMIAILSAGAWLTLAVDGPSVNNESQTLGEKGLETRLEKIPEPRLEGLDAPSFDVTMPEKNKWLKSLSPVRRQENERLALQSYGWVDKQHGIARLPIDLAIDVFVEQQHFVSERSAQNSEVQDNEENH
jgi:hypothetical protein